jgi:hypothetical protein
MSVDLGGWRRLDERQSQVARRVVAEESAVRSHLVVYLSGAHAYGFPSPDSDLDLKCVHAVPTAALLGLAPPAPAEERCEVVEGVEVDYGSNELAPVMRGLLAGNGNYLERVAGECALQAGADLEALRALVPALVSRRYARHYRGFATQQLRQLEERATVKRALYVLRTALTGAHLLATGEVVTDVEVLFDRFGLPAGRKLVERKRAGEQAPLARAEVAEARRLLDAAFTMLDRAEAGSALPAEPAGADAADEWLRAFRLARL